MVAATGPTMMVCGLACALVVVTHRAGFERRRDLGAGIGHRHALLDEQDAENQRDRQIDVHADAPHIDEEIADRRLAAERANDRRKGAEPYRRGQEHVRQDEECLAEVREMLIARIVLQIRIRHKGYDGVEDRRRLQHAAAERIQRRQRLQREDDEAEHEQRDAEDHQREHVLLPILRTGVEQVLDQAQRARRAIFAVHQPGEIGAQRNR